MSPVIVIGGRIRIRTLACFFSHFAVPFTALFFEQGEKEGEDVLCDDLIALGGGVG